MYKISRLILLLVATVILTGGCALSKVEGSNKKSKANDIITEVKFKDMISVVELQKLEGTKVTMNGFIGGSSPLDGSYIYLMNMPYQNCAFCVPNTTQLVNTMAVYPKTGKTFEFMDTPIKVTGILKFEAITDPMGYQYNYRLVDATYEKADVSGLEEDIKIYTAIVDSGFVVTYNKIMSELYTANYMEPGKAKNFKDTPKINTDLLLELNGILNSLNKKDYPDVVALLEEIEVLVEETNKAIEIEDVNIITSLIEKVYEVNNSFYQWLTKPQL